MRDHDEELIETGQEFVKADVIGGIMCPQPFAQPMRSRRSALLCAWHLHGHVYLILHLFF